MKKVVVTGSAGFIGYHLSKMLLDEGFAVLGVDGMTSYYDVKLKEKRNQFLLQHETFAFTEIMIENQIQLEEAITSFEPDVIIHLAAQAGVRYSIENPETYIDSNLVGFFNVMSAAKKCNVKHFMAASTSSVYGANDKMPFKETDRCDTPLTLYAATKKANELMAHSYSNIWGIPTTMFRFFTVYGPWGRPDLALFKFVDAMLAGRPIDIYNHGNMYRDFTYVTDLTRAILLLMDKVPSLPNLRDETPIENDSLSVAAPYRVVNIGNSKKVRLMDFIEAIEAELGIVAEKNFMDMQIGDVPATWADCTLLKTLTGYQPSTDIKEGVSSFVNWYKNSFSPVR